MIRERGEKIGEERRRRDLKEKMSKSKFYVCERCVGGERQDARIKREARERRALRFIGT